MAEMEKEGRPPENKRSRKPAHPVKREINEEMKVRAERAHPWAGETGELHGNPSYSMSFAENTMNELLGWYGYDKVDLRDSDDIELRNCPDGELRQHISVVKENSLPKASLMEHNSTSSPPHANSSRSTPTPRNGVTSEPSSTASTSAPSAKDHGGMPIIVPLIPPPVIKPPAEEDVSNVQIMCAWCQKVGVKRYSLCMGSELKSFCSEKCFAACRRAYFKRNKVCDWCKHIRHTKEYLDFGAGERRLQFCSAKCLNQYKMDIFYKETQAALPGGLCNPPPLGPGPEGGKGEGGGAGGPGGAGGVQLLTPESWSTPLSELRRKAPSPGGPTSAGPSGSASGSPSEHHAVCSSASSSSSSSASSVKIPTPRPSHDANATGPPPPPLPPHPVPPGLHPSLGVPPGSPPMVMTHRGPVPLPLFMEHQMMQHQMRPPFLWPPHTPGPNSPLSNPMLGPGIPGPPPPRNLGPPSSPMHRPQFSPHMHPSSTPTLGGNPPPSMMPPGHPHMPGLPFPPVNMMPGGPLPMPPVMNFGLPSLAPLVPPPTLLVPYPIIVPLPVPIPIPIPIPFSPKASEDRPAGNDGTVPSGSASGAPGGDSKDPRPFTPGSSRGGGGSEPKKGSSPNTDTLSPGYSGYSLGAERGSSSSSSSNRPGVVDLTVKVESPGGSGSGGGGGGTYNNTSSSSSSTCTSSLSSLSSASSSSSSHRSHCSSPAASAPTAAAPSEGVIDLTTSRRPRQQLVIQRTVPSVEVKVEAESSLLTPMVPSGEAEARRTEQSANISSGGGNGRGGSSTVTATGRGGEESDHRDADNALDSTAVVLPCGDSSFCGATPPLAQPITCSGTPALPAPAPPTPAPAVELGSAAPCNVIVNGGGGAPSMELAGARRMVTASASDQRPLLAEPASAALLESEEELKENSCAAAAEWDAAGKRGSSAAAAATGTATAAAANPEEAGGVVGGGGGGVVGGGLGGDPKLAAGGGDPGAVMDEEHAYALPTHLPPNKVGCVIQPVPKPGADKTGATILPCGLAPPLTATGPPEMEPPLKRRCLRIRNQNK